MKNKFKIWIPLFLGIAVAIGVIIGNFVVRASIPAEYNSQSNILKTIFSTSKLQTVMNLIDADYVEEISTDSITEDIIPQILKHLDPHSVYIPAKDLVMVNEDLEGSFSGIGVQFNIQSDTIMIISVIHDGPSEKLGILAGDRIVYVNDTLFVGDSITNEKTMNKLRGKKGTTVKLGIKRKSSEEILDFVVTRGDVPVKSIDISYMLTKDIGYIKISNFGAKTYEEFLTALAKLRYSGANKYVIDLRGNPGGYLDAAINITNEFLERGDLIVYTEGKSYARKDAYADGTGSAKQAKTAVLIDEWSASASEIFAGAIQDNDRGTIIGRRSFGKGLVQQQIPLSDGSAIRLTVARYYTPSGRSIQKPYEKGNKHDYEQDILNRFLHGEFISKDSIKISDSLRFETKNGRSVYGGGGIMADLFIPRDTLEYTPYFNKVFDLGCVYQYAFLYSDQNRQKLEQFKSWQEIYNYLQKEKVLNDFINYAEREGVKKNSAQIIKSKKLLTKYLYAYISRDILGDNAFYPILNKEDDFVQTAIKTLNKE